MPIPSSAVLAHVALGKSGGLLTGPVGCANTRNIEIRHRMPSLVLRSQSSGPLPSLSHPAFSGHQSGHFMGDTLVCVPIFINFYRTVLESSTKT